LKRHQSDGVGDELGAIVEAHEVRCTPLQGKAVKGGHDPVGVDGALHDDGGALPGVLVDDVEQLEGAAIGGGVELEVHRPKSVGGDGPHRPHGGGDATVGLLALAIGHLQAFLPPQALDALVVDAPALPPGLLGRSAPSPSRPLLGERPQPRPQLLLVLGHDGRIQALGGAVLADHTTCSALGDPEPLSQHHHGATAAIRGQ